MNQSPRPNPYRSLLMMPFCFVVVICSCRLAYGQVLDEARAAQVKAAYLYSFSKFVKWPDSKFLNHNEPIVMALIGEDIAEMRDLLKTVANDRGLIQGRPLRVLELDYVETPQDLPPTRARKVFEDQLKRCHLIFVEKSNRVMRQDLFEIIDRHKVLSVGGGEAFVRSGGMVSFVRKGESIVFQISVAAVKKEDLVISPKLLRNAVLIR